MVVYLEQNADKMKKHHLLLPVFLLFSCCLFAQNWWPVKTGETYHYRLPDSTHITHSIRVDSLKTQNVDSVFYLNRVLKTYVIPGEPLLEEDTIWISLYNQGQFLGQTMTKKPNGSLVFDAQNYFIDTSIVVYPNASQGDSWLAVADGNITATVTSVDEGFVLSIPDSLKTIQFSNGAKWVISKHHGLVSAPDFSTNSPIVTLSGLENQGLGDRLYRLEDFFDFKVGDVFEYRSSFIGQSGWGETRLKTKILEKTTLPDGFQYAVEKKLKNTWGGWTSGISIELDTMMIEYQQADYKNIGSYNKALISLSGNPYFWNEFSFVTHFNGGLRIGKRSTEIGAQEPCAVFQFPEDPNSATFYIDNALDCSPGGIFGEDKYLEEFRPGLGRTGYYVAIIDNTDSEWLTGAVLQGDTVWGSVTPDWFFTQTKEPKTISQPLKIYPNPAADFAIIEVENPIGSATIQILGPESRLIRTLKIERQDNTVKLDLAGLPTGVYFVLLQSETEIRRGKLLISSLRRP
jgi:hypothetical protein